MFHKTYNFLPGQLMFRINCKQKLQSTQVQPAHSCLVNHYLTSSRHFCQNNSYPLYKQEWSIPIATRDYRSNEYADRGSCARQTQVQTEDKRKTAEDVLIEMAFSFQLFVAD